MGASKQSLLFSLAVLALALARFGQCQSGPGDPVERLRNVLKDSTGDLTVRNGATRQCLSRVRTLADLRRAYFLAEWRDRSSEQALAGVDAANRSAFGEQFTQALRNSLHGKDAAQVVAAADMLAEIGAAVRGQADATDLHRQFTQDLLPLVRQSSLRAPLAAARALGQTDPPLDVVVPVFAELLRSKDMMGRHAAAEGLATLLQAAAQLAARNDSGGLEPAQRTAVATTAAIVLQALAPGLADWHMDVRRRCAGAVGLGATMLGQLATGPAASNASDLRPLAGLLRDLCPNLARGMRDADTEVRLLSQKAMEEMAVARGRWLEMGATDDPLLDGMKGALPALAQAVADPEVRVRRAALDVLELLGPAAGPATPAVQRALNDPDRFVRWSAIRALTGIGPEARAAAPALARLLDDIDLDLRVAAAAALDRVDPSRQATADGIQRVDYQPDPSLEARNALPAVLRSLKTSEVKTRLTAIQALREMGPVARPALPALREALKDLSPSVRRAAAECLGQFGPLAREAVPDLRTAIGDADAAVRRAAGDALLSIVRGEQEK